MVVKVLGADDVADLEYDVQKTDPERYCQWKMTRGVQRRLFYPLARDSRYPPPVLINVHMVSPDAGTKAQGDTCVQRTKAVIAKEAPSVTTGWRCYWPESQANRGASLHTSMEGRRHYQTPYRGSENWRLGRT